MKIKLSTLLWLLTLVAVFCAGWLAPSPFKPQRLEPILVTTSSFDFYHQISPDDVTVEMWPPELIPPNAATHINQIENGRLAIQYAKGSRIYRDDVFFNISDKGEHLGCRLVAVTVSNYLRNLNPPQVVSIKLGKEVILRSAKVAGKGTHYGIDSGGTVFFWIPESQVEKLLIFDLKNTVFTLEDLLD